MRLRNLIFLILLLNSSEINSQVLAKTRAAAMKDGMNLSYLEQYWLGNPAINYIDYLDFGHLPYIKSQLPLIKSLGFETVRLPVTFDKWENGVSPYNIDSIRYFTVIDSIILWCDLNNLMLVIDYHHGNLFDSNFNTELTRLNELWKEIGHRYAWTNPDKVLFEIYNEPFNISDANWKTAAVTVVNTLRFILPNHTLIVGANEYNSLYKLFSMGLLNDSNIIYTFHFYEPMIFTHQGASWVNAAVSTTGIPFPYDPTTMPPPDPNIFNAPASLPYNYYNYQYEGTCQAVNNSLSLVNYFKQMYNVPIWCGEFGSFNWYDPNDNSRCRYTECVKNTLDNYSIPYAYWEWDAGFSLFDGTPSWINLSTCMQNAFDIVTPPLPVQLTYFGGFNENSVNVLQWVTSSEVNNDYFEIERSLNNEFFEKIGMVAGNGTSSAQHSYSFIDKYAPEGISYYRIKQHDFNGDFNYTYVISIINKSRLITVKLSPNPATDEIRINSNENFTWVITSPALGTEIMRQENTYKADISSLPPGMYIAKIYNAMSDLISTQKFVKE